MRLSTFFPSLLCIEKYYMQERFKVKTTKSDIFEADANADLGHFLMKRPFLRHES